MKELEFLKIDDGDIYNSNTGCTYLMDKSKKIEYYNMLLNIPLINENEIVNLVFHQNGDLVRFNGLVAYKNLFGGFSIKGFIELNRGYIGLNYDLNNDNNYQFIGYNLKDEEKVRKVI